jgi:hypothetical protein
VFAPNKAVGAIVAIVGGDLIKLEVDPKLDVTKLRVDGTSAGIGARLLLKGRGPARARLLDDPRNAPKLAANVAEALGKIAPAHKQTFEDNRNAWARPFVRQLIAWQPRLKASKVASKRVRDAYGRIYLLEWGGGIVDPKAGWDGPPALANLPDDCDTPSAAAYEGYIARLIASIT